MLCLLFLLTSLLMIMFPLLVYIMLIAWKGVLCFYASCCVLFCCWCVCHVVVVVFILSYFFALVILILCKVHSFISLFIVFVFIFYKYARLLSVLLSFFSIMITKYIEKMWDRDRKRRKGEEEKRREGDKELCKEGERN